MNNLKHCFYLLVAALVLAQPSVIKAASAYQEAVAVHEVIDLGMLKTKIRKKEHFVLYIGREESYLAQQFAPKLRWAAEASQTNVYYLDTAGIDVKAYKIFARKYKVTFPAYLATFGGRKLLSQLSEIETANEEQILNYLMSVK